MFTHHIPHKLHPVTGVRENRGWSGVCGKRKKRKTLPHNIRVDHVALVRSPLCCLCTNYNQKWIIKGNLNNNLGSKGHYLGMLSLYMLIVLLWIIKMWLFWMGGRSFRESLCFIFAYLGFTLLECSSVCRSIFRCSIFLFFSLPDSLLTLWTLKLFFFYLQVVPCLEP